MTQRARFCRGTATVVLALAALGGFPGTWAATESDVRQDQAQAPGTPQLRASIRIEPAADPAATQTAPQSAGGAAPAPSSTTTAVLGQPLNVVVDVPVGSVTGTRINVTVSEPFGKSSVLVLTAQPGTANGFTTFTTQAPVSFGGGRGGFTGPGDLLSDRHDQRSRPEQRRCADLHRHHAGRGRADLLVRVRQLDSTGHCHGARCG